jgi:hypothetical protein
MTAPAPSCDSCSHACAMYGAPGMVFWCRLHKREAGELCSGYQREPGSDDE